MMGYSEIPIAYLLQYFVFDEITLLGLIGAGVILLAAFASIGLEFWRKRREDLRADMIERNISNLKRKRQTQESRSSSKIKHLPTGGQKRLLSDVGNPNQPYILN